MSVLPVFFNIIVEMDQTVAEISRFFGFSSEAILDYKIPLILMANELRE